MKILVCVKRVPDPGESEILINEDATGVMEEDLVYSLNEWDQFAMEEALQLREKAGGSVSVVHVGDRDAVDVLHRCIAMGADDATLLYDEAFAGCDGRGDAIVLSSFIKQNNYDLILLGVESSDLGSAQIPGMIAAILNMPYIPLVNKIEIVNDNRLKVHKEVEGGNQEVYEITTPSVLSIMSGANEPRYVSFRAIKKASKITIPIKSMSDLDVSADQVGDSAARVRVVRYFVPERGEGAVFLEGDMEEKAAKLVEYMRSKGGLK